MSTAEAKAGTPDGVTSDGAGVEAKTTLPKPKTTATGPMQPIVEGVGDLSTYTAESIDIVQEYWTPEKEGDSRRLVFWGFEDRKCIDQETGDLIDLTCVVFVDLCKDGPHRYVCNGSKRLVAAFERINCEQGDPFEITYRGEKKNKTNANKSHDWSVQPLAKPKS